MATAAHEETHKALYISYQTYSFLFLRFFFVFLLAPDFTVETMAECDIILFIE